MKNIRYYIFWLLDILSGSKIKQHYQEVEKSFYNEKFKNKAQKKNIESILKYAVENTEYYNKYDYLSFGSFPVINKKEIIDNYYMMFSKEFLGKKDSLRTMSTSGSSGTPFRIHQDKGKVERNKADLLLFYKLGGYNIGDRMYFMRIWNSLNKKSKLSLFKENFRMYDTSNLDVSGALNFKETMLNDKTNKSILGYASSFTALMDNIDLDNNINWKIKSIITGAEELPIPVKRKMVDIFKCPVMSRYSNQENGILAQQPISGEDYFELNEGSYFFEFLKIDSDEPAKEGEIARVVITDLFNKAIPIIRYDTADLCTFGIENGRKVIKSIDGRSVDLLKNDKEEVLSPHVVTNLMWKFPEVKEYQLIQKDIYNLELTLVHSTIKKNRFIDKLKIELKDVFGSSINIEIKEVEHIPLEKNGKRKYIKSFINV